MEVQQDPVGTVVSDSQQPVPSDVKRTGWVGWSFVFGAILAVPWGWLLAYLAALPFMLGLFFFLLLGLLIAASMFRVGSRCRPPSTLGAVAIATGVAVVLMAVSLWVEYLALPRSVERTVRDSFYETLVPQRRAELREGLEPFVAETLKRDYPPGGFVGYLHWAATNGKMSCPRIIRDSTVDYRLPYARKLWIVRVSLSALLVWWTMLSQTLALRLQPAVVADVSESPPAGTAGSGTDS